MAIPRGLNLQSLGLTGRPRMLPFSLPSKYDLSMRRPVQPTDMAPSAGLAPAIAPIKPDFGAGLGLGGGATAAPGMTGDVPDSLPDPGLNYSDIKEALIGGLIGAGAGFLSPVPGGAAVGFANGVHQGIRGKLINEQVIPAVKKYIGEPIKNVLGFGEKNDAQGLGSAPQGFSGIEAGSYPEALSESEMAGAPPGFSVHEAGPMPGPTEDRGWFDGYDSDDDTPIG